MQQEDNSNEFGNPYAAPHLPDVQGATDPSGHLSQLTGNPLKTVWLKPRQTVRSIVATNPELYVVQLVALAGIGQTLDRASMRNAGDDLPLSVILGIALLLGPLGGLISLWFSSHLLRFSGSWIGGLGNRQHIKTAIAWASVPSVFALPLWVPQILLFGTDMFTEATPRLDAQPSLWIPFLVIGIMELVLGLWGLVLLCNTLAEVQGFRSAWSGLGNIFLAAAVIVVPLLALVVLGLALL